MSLAQITVKCMLPRCNKYAHLPAAVRLSTQRRRMDWHHCVRRHEREVRQGRVLSTLLATLSAAFSTRLGCKYDSNLGYTLCASTFVKRTANSAEHMRLEKAGILGDLLNF